MIHRVFKFLFISSVIFTPFMRTAGAWDWGLFPKGSTTASSKPETASTNELFVHKNIVNVSPSVLSIELNTTSTEEPERTTTPSTSTLFSILSTTRLPSSTPGDEPSTPTALEARNQENELNSETNPPTTSTTSSSTTTTTTTTTTTSTTTTPSPDTSTTIDTTTIGTSTFDTSTVGSTITDSTTSVTVGIAEEPDSTRTTDAVNSTQESTPYPDPSGGNKTFRAISDDPNSSNSSFNSSNSGESDYMLPNATFTSFESFETPTPNVTFVPNDSSAVSSSILDGVAESPNQSNSLHEPRNTLEELGSMYDPLIILNVTPNTTTESVTVKVNVSTTSTTTTLPVEVSTAKRVTSGANPIGSNGLLSVIVFSILILEICS